MPEIPKVEFEKRVRIVQEWILEDWPSSDIVTQVGLKWGLGERQAKRYLAEARKRWANQEDELIDQKRKLKIESLKKLKRSLKDNHKGTPEGVRAILAVEKEIIQLDGLRKPVKLEIGNPKGQPFRVQNDTKFEIDYGKLPIAVLEQIVAARQPIIDK